MALKSISKMIILRQNLYAESKHGVFQYYIEHENELDDVEKRKFEALKKKYSKEWEEVKSGKQSSSNQQKTWEDFKNSNEFKDWKDDMKKSFKLTTGLSTAALGVNLGHNIARQVRRNKATTGKRENIGKTQRARLEGYKELTERQKKNLESGKTKYAIGRAGGEALRSGLTSAAWASAIGGIGGFKGSKKSAELGAVVGSIKGAVRGYKKGKKDLERVKDYEQERDLVRVSRGKMTETEYKKKYNL